MGKRSLRKILLWNCPNELVECSLDDLAKPKHFDEKANFFPQGTKKGRRHEIFKNKDSKMIPRTRWMQFGQSRRKTVNTRPQIFCSTSQMLKFFFRRAIFPANFFWRHTRQLWKPCQKLLAREPETFHSKSKNDLGKSFTLQLSFLKRFFLRPRMQLWKCCPKYLSEEQVFLAQCPEIIQKSEFFWRTIFLKVFDLEHKISSCENPAKKICRGAENFLFKVRKWFEKTFSKKNYFLNQFLWISGNQIWHPCRKFLAIKWKSFRIMSSNDDRFFFKEMFCLEMILWTRRMQFWQPRPENIDQNQEIFGSWSEKDRKCFFFKTRYYSRKSFYGLVECSFGDTAEKTREEAKKFSHRVRKRRKNYNVFKKTSPKMFLWTRQMQLGQLSWKIFDNRPRNYRSMSKIEWKGFSEDLSFFKKFFSRLRMQSWKPCQKMFVREWNFFRSMSRIGWSFV